MFIFIVTPHSHDPEFEAKMRALSDAAREVGAEIGWTSPASLKNTADESVGLAELRRSDAVMGDLSFERPSCYFEIGLAYGMDKPVFLIAKRGTQLHQVIGREAVEFYSGLDEYKKVAIKVLSRIGTL
jgi:nucleoside 2-deoxyribosyltransferase